MIRILEYLFSRKEPGHSAVLVILQFQSIQKRELNSVATRSCGVKFDCYLSDDIKRDAEQKCWLYDLYVRNEFVLRDTELLNVCIDHVSTENYVVSAIPCTYISKKEHVFFRQIFMAAALRAKQ